ncbi:hypothetical protein BK131_00805 [Paenibacillus amylolyticus]|uniref:Uncharacterized protein n=1 Tax=Paenibacillus amylolyticus TaxID=1451 RepID=A0A1R1C365_PAEAM|nr:hypothetical protein BK131_00805 [Paenibacillus amylolyticus]
MMVPYLHSLQHYAYSVFKTHREVWTWEIKFLDLFRETSVNIIFMLRSLVFARMHGIKPKNVQKKKIGEPILKSNFHSYGVKKQFSIDSRIYVNLTE